jgi:hypothetical protein
MADKVIGSLIYGEHELPKKQRPWKQRLKVPVSIGLVLIVVSGLAYKFANFREERRVSQFLEELTTGNYDAAYAGWDNSEGRYTMKDFLVDWGQDGYYTKGMKKAEVIDSNGRGTAVIVYVGIDNVKVPVALRVDKETLMLSFSPTNKYDLANP